jgi:hypothetical protein
MCFLGIPGIAKTWMCPARVAGLQQLSGATSRPLSQQRVLWQVASCWEGCTVGKRGLSEPNPLAKSLSLPPSYPACVSTFIILHCNRQFDSNDFLQHHALLREGHGTICMVQCNKNGTSHPPLKNDSDF